MAFSHHSYTFPTLFNIDKLIEELSGVGVTVDYDDISRDTIGNNLIIYHDDADATTVSTTVAAHVGGNTTANQEVADARADLDSLQSKASDIINEVPLVSFTTSEVDKAIAAMITLRKHGY